MDRPSRGRADDCQNLALADKIFPRRTCVVGRLHHNDTFIIRGHCITLRSVRPLLDVYIQWRAAVVSCWLGDYTFGELRYDQKGASFLVARFSNKMACHRIGKKFCQALTRSLLPIE
jgi:hypothetical protein